MSSAEAPARLLVVDDEAPILEMLSDSLRFAGFQVQAAASGAQALRLAAAQPPDLVVLDVMMPGIDGFEVVRRLRADGAVVPVLFLTARGTSDDTIKGLSLGADDYVTKPFSLGELVARIEALLRRSRGDYSPAATRHDVLRVGDLVLDDGAHEVTRGGVPVEVSATEFKLLRFLMTHAGRVMSKAQILDHVWHYDFDGDGNIVESYISRLRRKVDTAEPRLLHTVRGVGYVVRVPR